MKIFESVLHVRSYECDFYGHANNAVYLNYLEFARMETLTSQGFTLESLQKKGYLTVIRRIEIDYKYPVRMNDKLIIRTFLSDAGKTSGTFTQQIIRAEDERLAADARVIWVFTDLKGKPQPIPADIRAAFGIE